VSPPGQRNERRSPVKVANACRCPNPIGIRPEDPAQMGMSPWPRLQACDVGACGPSLWLLKPERTPDGVRCVSGRWPGLCGAGAPPLRAWVGSWGRHRGEAGGSLNAYQAQGRRQAAAGGQGPGPWPVVRARRARRDGAGLTPWIGRRLASCTQAGRGEAPGAVALAFAFPPDQRSVRASARPLNLKLLKA